MEKNRQAAKQVREVWARARQAEMNRQAGLATFSLVDRRKLLDIRRSVYKNGDQEVGNALSAIQNEIAKRLAVDSNTEHAIRTLANFAYKGYTDPAQTRNTVAKIANLLGIRLTPGSF